MAALDVPETDDYQKEMINEHASTNQGLHLFLKRLETVAPFDDPQKIYSRSPDFSAGRCGEYTRMLHYVLDRCGYPSVKFAYFNKRSPHEYIIAKNGGQFEIIDWTQSQFFGDEHFYGTFEQLVEKIQGACDLPDRAAAVKQVGYWYGIGSEEALKNIFVQRYEEQHQASAAKPNLYASYQRVCDLPMNEAEQLVDFNRDVLPKLEVPIPRALGSNASAQKMNSFHCSSQGQEI